MADFYNEETLKELVDREPEADHGQGRAYTGVQSPLGSQASAHQGHVRTFLGHDGSEVLWRVLTL